MNSNLVGSVLGAVICLGAWTWGWYSIGYKLGQEQEIEKEIERSREFSDWVNKRGGK